MDKNFQDGYVDHFESMRLEQRPPSGRCVLADDHRHVWVLGDVRGYLFCCVSNGPMAVSFGIWVSLRLLVDWVRYLPFVFACLDYRRHNTLVTNVSYPSLCGETKNCNPKVKHLYPH